MPRIKILSGKDVVNILKGFNFYIISQKGSHIKLQRIHNGDKQTLTIPIHEELDKGTTSAIYRQVLKYIAEGEIKKYFYQ